MPEMSTLFFSFSLSASTSGGGGGAVSIPSFGVASGTYHLNIPVRSLSYWSIPSSLSAGPDARKFVRLPEHSLGVTSASLLYALLVVDSILPCLLRMPASASELSLEEVISMEAAAMVSRTPSSVSMFTTFSLGPAPADRESGRSLCTSEVIFLSGEKRNPNAVASNRSLSSSSFSGGRASSTRDAPVPVSPSPAGTEADTDLEWERGAPSVSPLSMSPPSVSSTSESELFPMNMARLTPL
mmetsp:Transcript_47255/g.92171  ORF Transcript_47255/g.92171 Transcript_47255/m.92171 type:complete len:241 (-) Transcript_47255:719-1441(-)